MDDANDAKIKDLYEAGVHRPDIGRELGISEYVVKLRITSMGLTKRTKHSQETINKVLELHSLGYDRQTISDKVKLTKGQSDKIILNAGVKLDPKHRSANHSAAQVKRNNKYPAGTTEKIVELRTKGVECGDISVLLNVPLEKVLADIKRIGVILTEEQKSNTYRKYAQEQIDRAVELRKNGLTIEEISRRLGLTTDTIQYFMNKTKTKAE